MFFKEFEPFGFFLLNELCHFNICREKRGKQKALGKILYNSLNSADINPQTKDSILFKKSFLH